jgi:hypothetical protein
VADYVIAGGTLLYLILAFFPWWDYGSIYGFQISARGFSSGLVTFAFVLFLAATAWTLLPALTRLELGFPRGLITVGLAALGFVLTLIAWIDTLGVGFSIWALLGLIVSVAITVFALLSLLPQLRNRPALAGPLAGAAQWANQRGPQFGPGGQPGGSVPPPPGQFAPPQGPPPGAPHGQPVQPYGGHPGAGQPPGPAATPPTQPFTHPSPPPYSGAPGSPDSGEPGGGTGSTASGTGESGPDDAPRTS